jgi:hypothetical protein
VLIGDRDGEKITAFIAARIDEDERAATAADDEVLLVTLWAMRDMNVLLGRALAGDPYVPIAPGWAETLILNLVQRWRAHVDFRFEWKAWTETELEELRNIHRGGIC